MKYLIFLTGILIPCVLVGQQMIRGRCVDSLQNGIPFPSIMLYTGSSKQFSSFVIGDKQGNFTIALDSVKKDLQLKITALSFADTIIKLSSNKDWIFNNAIILKSIVRNLKEIVIHSDRSITDKGDTISMKAKYFANGSEKVLEDLLKRLPGLDVASDGSIRVNGKEIEKIMVEGDDFFEKGYKILSQNMPPNVVDRVEIIQRYEPQRLKKGLKESNKVALNLKLTDDAKQKWFGNLDISGSPSANQFYKGRTNIMNFTKKTKAYLLTSANTVGENIDISLLDQIGNAKEEVAEDDQSIDILQPVVRFSPNSILLPAKKYAFNRLMINSGNLIIRPFHNTKIRIGFNRLSDRIETLQNTEESVVLQDTMFNNKESSIIQKQSGTYLGKLNWQTDTDSLTSFNVDLYWLHTNNNENANTIFNTKSLLENSSFRHNYIFYKTTLLKRVNDKNLLQISFSGHAENLPLYYISTPFLPSSFFNIPATSYSSQTIHQNRSERNCSMTYTNKLTATSTLDINFVYSFQEVRQYGNLVFKNMDSVFDAGNKFKGDAFLEQQKIFTKISLSKKWRTLSFVPSVDLVNVQQSFISTNSTELSCFFINPSITIGFQPHKKHKLIGIVGSNNNVPLFDNIQPIFLMNGFRSFQRGSNLIEPISQSTKILSYTVGNWADRFFVNLFYLDILEHNFLGSNSIITPDAVFAERIWLHDKQTKNLNASVDFFINQINSNLKLTNQLSSAILYNVVNSSNIRKIESNSVTVGLEAKSVFKGIYNHHIGLKRTLTYNRSEQNRSFIFHSGFIDMFFKASKFGSFKVKTEGFLFPKERVNKDFLLFSDMEWNKSFINSKLNIGVSVSNLWDQTSFVNISLSDISVVSSSTRLLPRVFLMNLVYRF